MESLTDDIQEKIIIYIESDGEETTHQMLENDEFDIKEEEEECNSDQDMLDFMDIKFEPGDYEEDEGSMGDSFDHIKEESTDDYHEYIYLEIDEDLPVQVASVINEDQRCNRTKRLGSNIVSCEYCGKQLNERSLARHLIVHQREECELCGKVFQDYEDLQEHKHEHTGSGYCCDTCNVSFNDVLEFVIHKHKHTKTYSCALCKFVTVNKSSIKGHIRRHEGNFPVSCYICGKGFLSKALLDSHVEMHLDIKRYGCEVCGKKFSVKRYLHIHKSLNHRKELYGEEVLYQCEVCGRKFTFEKSLRRHQSVIHHIGEDRTVECKICHKIIANNYNLKMHMRIHTGEKKYCCDQCGKAFSAHKYYKKHKQIHDREVQYQRDAELVNRNVPETDYEDDDIFLDEITSLMKG